MLAFISGGTNGIDADVAARPAGNGASAIVTGLSEERGARATLRRLATRRRRVFAQFDVSDEAAWRETFQRHVGGRPLDFRS